MREGSGEQVHLTADKDTAFVTVTARQYLSMWDSHLSTAAFTRITEPVDFKSLQRKSRQLADKALRAKLITKSEHRFLTKDCTGDTREPRGSLKVKTHKHTDPTAYPPARTRMYIDVVNYCTTAWAKYLSVQLTPARARIPGRITDTRDFIAKLREHRFSIDCWILSADIEEFYPNTRVSEGEKTISKNVDPTLRELCTEASQLIHESIYIATPSGIHKLEGRYGIGLGHSGEVCDLEWSQNEQEVIAALTVAQTAALSFWCRSTDDYLMVLEGPVEHRLAVINAFKAKDPDRPLTFQTSEFSIDYLDVTVYKGSQFHSTGILDTKPYTKPSYTGMHLPYSSHHPQSTFDSILSGYHNRSLISSSSWSVHLLCMNQKYAAFSMRGYTSRIMLKWLMQDTTKSKRKWRERREEALSRKRPRDDSTTRIIPLKLQYTPRTQTLSKALSVAKLQGDIESASPALSRASLGKLTICNLKSLNLREACRPRGYITLQQDECDQEQMNRTAEEVAAAASPISDE